MNSKKTLFSFAFGLLFCVGTLAQSTANPDTVCVSTTHSYDVAPNPGGTYTWGLMSALGTINTTAQSDSISIDWDATPGIDTLWVVEAGPIGCSGDTIKLAVVLIATPTATIAGTDSLCINNAWAGNPVSVSFTSTGPWTFSYTYDLDGLGALPAVTDTITTATSPYNLSSPIFTADTEVEFSIQSISTAYCTGTYSGTGSVTVFPKPTTPTITRY